jgi:hypothetical protein
MPEFQLFVTKFKKDKPRISALYNLLYTKLKLALGTASNSTQLPFWSKEQKIAAQLKILGLEDSKDKIDRILLKEDINACLIVLKNRADLYNLTEDQDYTLYDRHIRIDRDYGMPNSVLAEKLFLNWHYTERWKKAGEYLEIHAYYHHGIFQSLWIRTVIDGKRRENIQETSALRIMHAKKNALDAHKIALDLLEKVINYKGKIQIEFEALMDELSIEKLNGLSAEQLNTKIQACAQKHEELNDFLEDYYDPRFKMLVNNIAKALEQQKSLTLANNLAQEEEEVASILTSTDKAASNATVVALSTLPKVKPNLPKQVAKLQKHIQQAIAEFNGEKLIDLQTQREKLLTEIIVEHFNADNQDYMQKLNQAHAQLQTLPSLEFCLEKFAYDGKITPFKILLPKIVDKLSFAFFENYILYITSKCANNQQQAHAKICEELFKASSVYRMFISLTKRSSIGYAITDSNVKIHFSPYFKMVLDDKFELFSTLVKQCADPAIDGLIIDNKALSLLSAVIGLESQPKYIKFLLDNGAIVEDVRGAEHRIFNETSQIQANSRVLFSNNIYRRIIEQRNINTARNNAQHPEAVFFCYLTEFNSSLVTLMQDERYFTDLLDLIVHDSNEENLVLALARLSIQRDIGSITCLSDQITFAQTSEERINIAKQRMHANFDFKKHVSLVFGAENPAAKSFLKKLISYVNSRLAVLNQEQIESLVKKSFEFGLEQEKKLFVYNTLIAFKAILLLESFNSSTLESHQRIIYALVKIGHCYRKDNSGWLDKKLAERQAVTNFINAKNFAELSVFRESLVVSKAYSEACKSENQNLTVAMGCGRFGVSLHPGF